MAGTIVGPVATENDVSALRQLANAVYRRYATTYAAARDFAVRELVEQIGARGLVDVAVHEMAGLLLDQAKRVANVPVFRRAEKREQERIDSSLPAVPTTTIVTGDSVGTGLPRVCRMSEFRELLDIRLWNRKRVRDATREELLEHCTRLEAQAATNTQRARQIRALAKIVRSGETALAAIRREEQGGEDASWLKSTSMVS